MFILILVFTACSSPKQKESQNQVPPSYNNIVSINFDEDKKNSDSIHFASILGQWYIDNENDKKVYVVDGRKYHTGAFSANAEANAKLLFSDEYKGFLDQTESYKEFPLTVCKDIESFKNGFIEVNYKSISGEIDQAAGIAFNIKSNGNYLVFRANSLENNVTLFNVEKGQRNIIKSSNISNQETNRTQNIKVKVNNNRIQCYVDDTEYIDYNYNESIDGKVGLWSKADSYEYFYNFIVKTE